jgi:Transglycosylase SLT domain
MRALALLLLCCLYVQGALADRLEIPLRIPFDAIGEALGRQLAYREGRCRSMKLEKPAVDAVDGRLRLSGPASGRLGVEFSGNCRNVATWHGTVQLTLEPWLDQAGRLRVRIHDSRLTRAPGGGAALLWDLSKPHVHPRLQTFSYDIGALRSALLGIVRSVAPPEHGAELEAMLTQLEILQPRIDATGVVVPVALDVPAAWLAAPPPAASSAPLTEDELAALDAALQPWDAFLAYTIKQVALDSEDRALRQRLFTLLLESRYALAAILSGETRAAGDPVRTLFIDAWSELRTILADTRYTVFLDAGDALVALDRAAPGLGMRVSADGLRQLARSLRPGSAADPLAYDWAVDPQLGALFEVEPIPQPAPSPPGRSWLDLFITRAHAADEKPLDRWVPSRGELTAYEARIGELLQKTSASELQRGGLAAPHDRIYRSLVPATALIESCWRQYEVRAGKVGYLRSASGSVGIMQINQNVWRGFYDVQRLRWDTAYNMRAGAQILMRYLKDYAIPYAARSGDPNHVPRAAYAVYNAGPRAVGRFSKNPPHPREQRVDERLWTLYQGIAAGGQADLRSCNVSNATAAR